MTNELTHSGEEGQKAAMAQLLYKVQHTVDLALNDLLLFSGTAPAPMPHVLQLGRHARDAVRELDLAISNQPTSEIKIIPAREYQATEGDGFSEQFIADFQSRGATFLGCVEQLEKAYADLYATLPSMRDRLIDIRNDLRAENVDIGQVTEKLERLIAPAKNPRTNRVDASAEVPLYVRTDAALHRVHEKHEELQKAWKAWHSTFSHEISTYGKRERPDDAFDSPGMAQLNGQIRLLELMLPGYYNTPFRLNQILHGIPEMDTNVPIFPAPWKALANLPEQIKQNPAYIALDRDGQLGGPGM